eukprot:scaffold89235_cov60-Phaeocystis_antarctica.AAC.2
MFALKGGTRTFPHIAEARPLSPPSTSNKIHVRHRTASDLTSAEKPPAGRSGKGHTPWRRSSFPSYRSRYSRHLLYARSHGCLSYRAVLGCDARSIDWTQWVWRWRGGIDGGGGGGAGSGGGDADARGGGRRVQAWRADRVLHHAALRLEQPSAARRLDLHGARTATADAQRPVRHRGAGGPAVGWAAAGTEHRAALDARDRRDRRGGRCLGACGRRAGAAQVLRHDGQSVRPLSHLGGARSLPDPADHADRAPRPGAAGSAHPTPRVDGHRAGSRGRRPLHTGPRCCTHRGLVPGRRALRACGGLLRLVRPAPFLLGQEGHADPADHQQDRRTGLPLRAGAGRRHLRVARLRGRRGRRGGLCGGRHARRGAATRAGRALVWRRRQRHRELPAGGWAAGHRAGARAGALRLAAALGGAAGGVAAGRDRGARGRARRHRIPCGGPVGGDGTAAGPRLRRGDMRDLEAFGGVEWSVRSESQT